MKRLTNAFLLILTMLIFSAPLEAQAPQAKKGGRADYESINHRTGSILGTITVALALVQTSTNVSEAIGQTKDADVAAMIKAARPPSADSAKEEKRTAVKYLLGEFARYASAATEQADEMIVNTAVKKHLISELAFIRDVQRLLTTVQEGIERITAAENRMAESKRQRIRQLGESGAIPFEKSVQLEQEILTQVLIDSTTNPLPNVREKLLDTEYRLAKAIESPKSTERTTSAKRKRTKR